MSISPHQALLARNSINQRFPGSLRGSWRDFDFFPAPTAIERFGIDSPILSVAVPLAPMPNRSKKRQRQNFFHGLLPEGRMLRRLADEASLPEHDVMGLLSRYGRDVAGALQIWDPENPGEPPNPTCEPLTSEGVENLLAAIADYPLGNKPPGGKTSLAGVQHKIVLARTENGWNRVMGGHPSTHILKPPTTQYPTGIYDEEYASRLARALGLVDYQVWIEQFGSIPALVVQRYDRAPDAPQGRVHQEDFAQALGVSGDQKYQRYGGHVSLARIAAIISTVAGQPGLEQLLRLVTLSVAVGNLDLHAKNLSLLHPLSGPPTLAPAYDIVPQAHLPGDGEMALAIGGHYRHAGLTRAHLVNEATTWGLRQPELVVNHTLETLLETTATTAPHQNAFPDLVQQISSFTSNLLVDQEVGRRSG